MSVRQRQLPGGELLLRWRIDGARQVILPPEAGRNRADNLWKTTCFELFLDLGDGRYREFNFSPSGQWAAWDFASYREREGDAALLVEPVIEVHRGDLVVAGSVRLPASALAGARSAALCAVIEESGEHLSFWSTRHGGEKPDFHDAACFTIDLTAPESS